MQEVTLILDADGGDIRLKDGGSTIFEFRTTSTPRLLSNGSGFLLRLMEVL